MDGNDLMGCRPTDTNLRVRFKNNLTHEMIRHAACVCSYVDGAEYPVTLSLNAAISDAGFSELFYPLYGSLQP